MVNCKQMGKHKIAFVIPSLAPGGAERVVSTLANNLINTFEVSIITYIKVEPFYNLHPNIKIHFCVDSISPSTNIFSALNSNYLLFQRISSIVKKEKIELLIGFLTSANVLSVLVSKYNSIPSIISERINPYSTNTPKIWQALRKITYPKANYVVVQTNEIKCYYSTNIKESKLVILPNPISDELTSQRENNPLKENIILNIGRLTNQKAQDILIEAFSQTKNQNWKLLIVGEGPKKKEYEVLINNLELQEKVILVGKTKDISTYYNKSKIFAFTSIFEGFPNALIEAMHFGLACISTDCPTGPSELITDDIDGNLIPMNNKNLLVDKLNILMENEAKRIEFGKNAMKKVEQYEVDKVVNDWKKIIKSSLSK
jgi:GalNAc-alpha-(1->4)-GalNAc-alpha-(1->3)-diNAcBac-PP-undecaprenol alpha-1,4-N-acetyl-D-galactosaminyltransferase